ncbi:MAG: PEP-CTERM system TPR-repeat protein PrsT [Ferruginibacter sp.]|nr:PEP-CTERM system TPR-repeat protein PrsT [Rhodoferax sp.]
MAVAVASFLVGCERDAMLAGREYFKKNDFTAAVIEFKNAVQAQPGSVEARLALADAMERTYDLVGAEQQLRKAADAGGDADVLVPRLALMMLDRNDIAKIINEFKDRHLKSPAADSDLRAVVAAAYVGQKQYAAADVQLKAAAQSTAATVLSRAQWLLAQDKKEQAMAALNNSLDAPDAPWWVLRGLGRVYESNGKREQSLQFMERAYKAAPWHRGVMGEYGEFLVGVGQLDKAIVIRDRLKIMAPGYYWTYFVDALVLSRQGRTEDSLASALKVLKVAPEHLPATLLVAAAELKKGDVLMADTRLNKIATQYPYSLPLLQLLAECQLRLGRNAEAVAALKRGLSVAPNDPRLLSLRAESEVARGANKEAVATLEKLSAADPGNPSYPLRLSELQVATGNREAAKKYLDQATKAGQDNAAIRDRIIAISLAMGDTVRVRQLADHAVQSRPKDPQSHLTLAAALDVQKDHVGAWRETSVALDLQAAFQPALTALGMLAKTPAQRAEVLARYEKGAQAKLASAQTFLEYARLLQVANTDPARVTNLLERGVAALPGSTALRQALVQQQIVLGKPDAALSVAQTGAFANSPAPEAVALLAQVYEQVGNMPLATETYRKLAVNYPQRADWRLKLAEMEANAGRKSEATSILRALISDRPSDSTAYIALAKLTWPDNLQEAVSIARELGEKEPYKSTAMLLEGDLLVLAGKPDQALQQYDKAAKAGAVPAAQLRSIQVLDRTQRGPSADQELANSLRKFPQDPSVIGFAAQRARAQGNPEKAVEFLQQIANKDPRNAVVLNDLAWAQIEARQPDALKNAMQAAVLAPNSPEILDTLGMAQAQANQQVEAIASLRTAVNIVPKAPTPRLHLAELYIAAGNPKDAATVMQSLDPKIMAPKDQETLARLKTKLGT